MSKKSERFGFLSLSSEEQAILRHLFARLPWIEERLRIATDELADAMKALADMHKAADHICAAFPSLGQERAETQALVDRTRQAWMDMMREHTMSSLTMAPETEW